MVVFFLTFICFFVVVAVLNENTIYAMDDDGMQKNGIRLRDEPCREMLTFLNVVNDFG